MPPRRPKKQSIQRKALALPGALEKAVSQAQTWPAVIEEICRFYNFPDLRTRRGLKECHKTIEIISSTLNDVFDRSTSSARLKGGVIGIYGKLCYDAVLRNKLCGTGYVSRIISMIGHEETHLIVLQTLATITRHGGRDIRYAIAKEATPGIVEVLRAHSTNGKVASLAICVLAHLVANIYFDKSPFYRQFPSIKMDDLLVAVYTGLVEVPFTPSTFFHGHDLVVSASCHAFATLERHPYLLDFIVASFRAPDLGTRVTSLSSLLTFHIRHEIQSTHVTQALERFEALKRLSPRLWALILSYGVEKSVSFQQAQTTLAFQRAQMQAAQTKDLFQLGLKLGELVLANENSVGDGYLGSDNGNRADLGLPYNDFMSSLPFAANALRERDFTKYCDMADMIEIKYHMHRREYPQVRLKSDAAMRRSKHAFWYYMRATAENEGPKARLKWAKLGLLCQRTSPYLRAGLLRLAASAAACFGIEHFECGNPGSESWHMAQAVLRSALEDSLSYIREAPPDSRSMRDMCILALLMTLVLKGGDISPDMRELRELRGKLKDADDINACLFDGVISTLWRCSYNTIIERYERATTFWESRFQACFSKDSTPNGQKEESPDDLAGWLSTLILEDGQKIYSQTCDHSSMTANVPFIDEHAIALYQCAYCRNPSAGLKRCSRCGVARYCDENQKEDWHKHKPQCFPKASAS